MKIFCLLLCFQFLQNLSGQSLLQELENENNASSDINYTEGTFKAVRLINGQTCETTEKRGLNVIISHRFGNINTGAYEMYGLDESVIRLGFDYGLTDRISLGYGRGNFQKLHDVYFKYKILRQSTGLVYMPVSLTWYSDMTLTSQRWTNTSVTYEFSSRLSYVNELLVARKFNPGFSSQLCFGLLHRNFVKTRKDQNNVPYAGAGLRYLLTKRLALTSEYYYLLPGTTADNMYNSFSVGIDIETGGHVFQIHVSNSRGMTEKIFVAENSGNWGNGDISIGFNIIRTFKL